MSMLPDGAETQSDDWTIFFLNQTSFNTISPVLALETPEKKLFHLPDEAYSSEKHGEGQELLCVLNLVRTKKDKTLNRWACFVTHLALAHHQLLAAQRSSH